MVKIFPSLIANDILNLESEIKKLEPHCDGFHLDVMDFHFVDNLTWGPQFINAIRNVTYKQLEIHLMVDFPEKYIPRFKLNSNDIVSIHYESPSNYTLEELFKDIKARNWLASLALSPNVSIDSVQKFGKLVDQVLLMSVRPGFSGQDFLSSSIERLKNLINLRKNYDCAFDISMDGGINFNTLDPLVINGVGQVTVGSGIFNQPDPVKELDKLYKQINEIKL